MTNYNVIQEWVELIAQLNPSQLVNYKPSIEIKNRLQDLVFKLNAGDLTQEEEAELRLHESFENLIGLAQARANQILEAA